MRPGCAGWQATWCGMPRQPAAVMLGQDVLPATTGALGTCLAAPITQFLSLVPNGDGRASLSIQHGPTLALAGSTWFFQAVSRQAITRGGQNGGLVHSNAVAVAMR